MTSESVEITGPGKISSDEWMNFNDDFFGKEKKALTIAL